MKTHVSVSQWQQRLATVWLVGSGVLSVLFVVQTMLGHFGANSELAGDAWGWFVPTVMPTLSLMIGVLVTDALHKPAVRKHAADPFVSHLAMWLSIGYLLILLLTVLLAPFNSTNPITPLKTSRLWVDPMQGLVGAALGAFFVKGAKADAGAGAGVG
jgi:hypothetical protein